MVQTRPKTSKEQIVPTQASPKKARFIGLRLKILVGFSLVFSGVFSGAYYWFYTFTTAKALERLSVDLKLTIQAAADGINKADFERLIAEGKQQVARGEFEAGTYPPKTNRLYWQHVGWLAEVTTIEPRIALYTFVPTDRPNFAIYIGSSGALRDSRSRKAPWGVTFLEGPYEIGQYSQAAFKTGEIVQNPNLYTDQWGNWLSAYAPLKNRAGRPIGIIGADIEADYVIEVQNAIRSSTLVAFAITYGSLFVLVYIVSGVLTSPLNKLKLAADHVSQGNYDQSDQSLSKLAGVRFADEIASLAQVLEIMVTKVRSREEALKQQVAELKIEIDQSKRHKQVSEIVETEFFQNLQLKARNMRSRGAPNPPSA